LSAIKREGKLTINLRKEAFFRFDGDLSCRLVSLVLLGI
jgi:hypothetical protein